ncbi:hypothetical protein ACIQPT_20790 [Streptomyces sp. NPDC091289]|uniref:hypothetical protein n=1 Tax=Streptomyces sp. NPDC091289 TaxID=3365989 RepID=UPI003816121F
MLPSDPDALGVPTVVGGLASSLPLSLPRSTANQTPPPMTATASTAATAMSPALFRGAGGPGCGGGKSPAPGVPYGPWGG